jgi:putative alpha-1,2-mannosidase
MNLSQSLIGDTTYESGALFSFEPTSDPIVIRVGVSFLSADQACSNAESEIGGASFEQVQEESRAAWQDRLQRIEIDVNGTLPNVTEMFYSSLYRASLTPVDKFYSFRCCVHMADGGEAEQCDRRGTGPVLWHTIPVF